MKCKQGKEVWWKYKVKGSFIRQHPDDAQYVFIFTCNHSFLRLSDVHICEHQPPCQNGAQCVYDRDGEYSCLCLEGFHGKDCELKTGPCEKAGWENLAEIDLGRHKGHKREVASQARSQDIILTSPNVATGVTPGTFWLDCTSFPFHLLLVSATWVGFPASPWCL